MDYEKIQAILNEVKPIVEENKKCRIEKWKNGDFFNIFSILKMETDEVKTHSAFLAELLNPKGSHGQGNIFIDEFVKYKEQLDSINKSYLDEVVNALVSAHADMVTANGRVYSIERDLEELARDYKDKPEVVDLYRKISDFTSLAFYLSKYIETSRSMILQLRSMSRDIVKDLEND